MNFISNEIVALPIYTEALEVEKIENLAKLLKKLLKKFTTKQEKDIVFGLLAGCLI